MSRFARYRPDRPGYVGAALASASSAPAAWTPASLTGLVDEWDADAAYCTTDAAVEFGAGGVPDQRLYVANDASLEIGDNDFSVALNFYHPGTASGTGYLVGVGWPHIAGSGWAILINMTGHTVELRVRNAADSTSVATAGIALANPGWNFLVATHDATNDQIALSLNGATPVTAALVGGTNVDGASNLQVGTLNTVQYDIDGRVQGLGIWKGRVLSSGDISTLYNSGNGTLYEDLTAGLKTSMVAWWNMHESTGARVDSHGSFDLTAANTPTVNAGVASGTVQDRSPVKTWTGKVNSKQFVQSTIANQPVWIASGQNGQPVLRADDVNDHMVYTHGGTLSQPNTTYIAANPDNGVTEVFFDGIGASNRHNLWHQSSNLQMISGATLTTLGTALTTFQIIDSLWSGTSSVSTRNGVEGTTGNAGTQALTGVTLFANYVPNTYMGGDVGHFILQNAAATSDEFVSARSYLNTKYAAY